MVSLGEVIHDEQFDHTSPLITQSYYYDNSFLCQTHTHHLKIFNTNARSLLKNLSHFETLFAQLSSHNFSFDILTFTETWLDPSIENFVYFENYTPIMKHKLPVKEGGGLAIFVKKYINYTIRNDLSFPEEKQNQFDGIFIELVPDNKQSRPIVLGNIYRSPRFNSVREFSQSLSSLVEKLNNENKEIIIVGDLNIDLIKSTTHKGTSEFLDSMLSNDLYPKITVPTRVTHSSATLIDHIYTNNKNSTTLAGTLKTDISDHFSNFIMLMNTPSKIKPRLITYRKCDKTSIENFNNALYNTNWTNVLSDTNTESAYDKFLDKYTSLKNKYLPFVTTKFNKYKHKMNTWVTKGILISLKTKDHLYKKLIRLKNNNNAQYDYHKDKYNKYKHLYNKILRTAKQQYWTEQFNMCKNDMKTTWKNINTILRRKNDKSSFPDFFKNDINNDITNPQNIAEEFNKFYVNIGPKLAQNIPQQQSAIPENTNSNIFPHSFFFTPVTPVEILAIVQKMKPKTSSGFDQISPKLLKQTVLAIVDPLCHIMNLSLSTGIVPSKCKIAKVLPFYKNDDVHKFKNYRPISLLPTFSKILERLVHNRLNKYLQTHKIINPAQYGFQQNLSTEMAILELQDRIANQLINNKLSLGVFLDLSKAFDTLDHSILLNKISKLGIRGLPLLWFTNYLNNRKQFVQYLENCSCKLTIKCGVPQGSILGPLLFLLYINDIPHPVDSNILLFADDTNLIFHNNDIKALTDSTNEKLLIISKWFQANKLSLNLDKTKYILFHKPRKKCAQNNVIIKINNTIIEQVKEIKFLGAYIDETLYWRTHITKKANQILKVNAVLSRLKNSVPRHILKTIYNSLIHPHLSYAITSWGNANNKEIKRLLQLQKRSIRNIARVKYNSHTNPLYKQLDLLKINDIFNLACSKFYLKIKQKLVPVYFQQQLPHNRSLHSYYTRNRNNLHIFHTTSKLNNQLINVKIAKVWNNLPSNIKNDTNYHSTELKIKTHLISRYPTVCNIRNCYVCLNT